MSAVLAIPHVPAIVPEEVVLSPICPTRDRSRPTGADPFRISRQTVAGPFEIAGPHGHVATDLVRGRIAYLVLRNLFLLAEPEAVFGRFVPGYFADRLVFTSTDWCTVRHRDPEPAALGDPAFR